MNKHDDKTLSELYRRSTQTQSPASLDATIMKLAAAEAETLREAHHKRRWGPQNLAMMAGACVFVIAVSLVIRSPSPELLETSLAPSADVQDIAKDLSERAFEESAESMPAAAPQTLQYEEVIAASSNEVREPLVAKMNVVAKPSIDATRQKMAAVAPEQDTVRKPAGPWLKTIESLIGRKDLATARIVFSEFSQRYPELLPMAVKKGEVPHHRNLVARESSAKMATTSSPEMGAMALTPNQERLKLRVLVINNILLEKSPDTTPDKQITDTDTDTDTMVDIEADEHRH